MNSLAGRFAGALDFYFWKGIPVVRKWPRPQQTAPSAKQNIWYYIFKSFAQSKSATPFEIRFFYRHWTEGTTWTWGDLMTSQGMEYYGATKKLPPGVFTPTIDTYYGQLRYIKFRTDSPEQPYLCRKLPKKTIVEYKEYRGRKEVCKRPRMGENFDCVKMNLMCIDGPGYTPAWDCKMRVATGQGTVLPYCLDAQGKALANYTAQPEEFVPVNEAWVAQNYMALPFKRCTASGWRAHSDWLCPTHYAGIDVNQFNGIKHTVEAARTDKFNGGSFSGLVFTSPWLIEPTLPSTIKTITNPVAFYPGKNYRINIFNTNYYDMPAYPICDAFPYTAGATLTPSNFIFTIGERWWWEYTFTPPYTASWWLSYPDATGRMHGVSPVSGKYKTTNP